MFEDMELTTANPSGQDVGNPDKFGPQPTQVRSKICRHTKRCRASLPGRSAIEARYLAT